MPPRWAACSTRSIMPTPASPEPGRYRGALIGAGGIARQSHLPALRRSEEHTSELQSQSNLVCRLLLEKKKKQTDSTISKSDRVVAHSSDNSTLISSLTDR